MKNRILCTAMYMLVVFIVYGIIRVVSGSENPFLEAGRWIIPLGIGYFLGWGHGQIELKKSCDNDD